MPQRDRTRRIALATGFVLAVVVAQLLRQRGTHAWDTVWGEDGFVYAADAYSRPALSTLFRGYAGYAQFVPRVLALPIRVLPASALAAYCAAVSAAVWALLALFVYRSMDGWIESRELRAALTLLMVIAPTAYYEVNANLANLGWPLLYAAMWAVASRRTGSADTALRAVVAGLAVLTTPVVFLVVPVAVIAAAVRRRSGDVVVAAAMGVAAAVQVLAINAAGPVPPFSDPKLRDMPVEYGVRVLASDVFGERWMSRLWLHLDVVLIVVALLAVAALVVLAAPWRMSRPRILAALVAGGASVVVFTASLWERGTGGMKLVSGEYNANDSRYVIVPALLLATALVLVADGSARQWLRVALAAQALAIAVTSFALLNPRSSGPTWHIELDHATAACASVPSGQSIDVGITPSGTVMKLPCDRVS